MFAVPGRVLIRHAEDPDRGLQFPGAGKRVERLGPRERLPGHARVRGQRGGSVRGLAIGQYGEVELARAAAGLLQVYPEPATAIAGGGHRPGCQASAQYRDRPSPSSTGFRAGSLRLSGADAAEVVRAGCAEGCLAWMRPGLSRRGRSRLSPSLSPPSGAAPAPPPPSPPL